MPRFIVASFTSFDQKDQKQASSISVQGVAEVDMIIERLGFNFTRLYSINEEN